MKNVVCYNSVLQSPAEPGAVCCIVGQRMAPFCGSSHTLALVMASLLLHGDSGKEQNSISIIQRIDGLFSVVSNKIHILSLIFE